MKDSFPTTIGRSASLERGARAIVIILTVFLFLLVTAAPLVQASRDEIPRVSAHVERRGVVRFEEYIPFSAGGFYKANVYALDTKDGLVLIDCGAEGLYGLLMDAIREEFHRKPIAAVLLTHGHADHAGAGHYFLESGVPVYAPAWDAYIIQNGMNFPGVPAEFTYTGYLPTGFLNDGDEMFGLKVIATPGHTYGSISLLDGKKALFTGDTTIGYPQDDVGPADQTYALEYGTLMYTDLNSLQLQLNSLNGLLGRVLEKGEKIDTIYPGHNAAYHPEKEVKKYLLHSIEVVQEVIEMK